VRYDWFLPAEVARYDNALAPGQPTRLDDATWSDLELDRYLDHLAAPCSIFGRQMLYHRLRAGGSPLMGTLDEAGLQAASLATAGLHQADTEVAGLLFEGTVPQLPTWTRWLGPLAWAYPPPSPCGR
jgi:hypothetical protein